ncbi:type IV pilus biogenesis protein PilM [Oceanobacillus piezotolerans]|nr:pilus assembly protein PilM [Oceanobacillus piezotolerans]
MLRKSKKIINIVIEDYIIRITENTGKGLTSLRLLREKPLPLGFLENGKIIDEIGFFDFMKELVKEFGIKNRQVRFYVPNSLVIMREVDFPAGLKEKEITEYFRDEIGKSIHLPFKDSVFDISYLPAENSNSSEEFGIQSEIRKGTLFAAPEDEMKKYTEILADVSLKPVAADVEALGVYRYYHHIYKMNKEHVYLFVQLNVTSINISIFHNHNLEFLRYQNLDVQLKGWHIDNEINEINWEYVEDENQLLGIVEDQLIELERIMNFYRFSLKKGESMVNEMVILGDHPLVNIFNQKVKNQVEIPVNYLKGYVTKHMDREVGSQFIPALGLALKGGAKDAS